jgi:7-carboxy-7-deazaguanine synthase
MLEQALDTALRVTEIFYSLQGETNTVGLPTVFVRLTGCPLRCVYCDTAYAFKGGQRIGLDDVLSQVKGYGCTHVTVTGGEPLAQPACIPLLRALCDQGYIVSLETSGALDVSAVDVRVVKVLDIKTPASGECARNLLSNFAYLRAQDQIKFVLCDREDYEWACAMIKNHQLQQRAPILFSPSYGQLAPGLLADWILADRLAVRLQIQLHKVLWGDKPGC